MLFYLTGKGTKEVDMKNGTDDAPRGACHKVAQDQAQEEWQCLPVHPAPPYGAGGPYLCENGFTDCCS